MNRRSRKLCLSVIYAIIGFKVEAGDLRKIWELRFSDLAGSRISDPGALVSALSFSPDGRHLATTMLGENRQSLLVIVDIGNPGVGATSIEVKGPVAADGESMPLAMSWSPTGDVVAVPTVTHTVDGASCALRHTNHVVLYDSDRVADGRPWFPQTDLLFFDTNCAPIGSWEIQGKWDLSDASADRHLLAILNVVPKQARMVVADPIGKRFVRIWPLLDVWPWPLFADSGRLVCALDGTGKHGVAHCWDVDSGAEVARTTSGNLHWPMKTALHAKRIIVSDYGWRIDLEGLETEVGSLKGWVVWDFGTRKKIASWKPRYQSYIHRSTEIKEPYKFAISPDGELVSEAGAGTLTLYRIMP